MTPLSQALAWLIAQVSHPDRTTIPLAQALYRVLARPTPLALSPTQPTATMAGLALRAAATEGASDYAPLPVQGTHVVPGTPMPPGTDAVLPDALHDDGQALAPVPPGHGVAPRGHDIPEGATLPAGTGLTPLHLALLTQAPVVFDRPRIQAGPAHLQALLRTAGADPTPATPDLVLQTAPLTHVTIDGLAIRPGETAALGHRGATPAIRLPAHPVDAAAVVTLLVAPLLRHLLLQPEPTPTPARLTRKVTSILGQQDLVRIRLEQGDATPLGPADGISLLAAAQANAYLLVPANSEGYPAGGTAPIYPA